MKTLISDFGQVQMIEEDAKPVTKGELREILSGFPVKEILQQGNMLAQQINNLQFHVAALVNFLSIYGLDRNPVDGSFKLNVNKWKAHLQDQIERQNQEVDKHLAEEKRKREEAAARPV